MKLLVFALIIFSSQSFAQIYHHFAFTGQPMESFSLTGSIVKEEYSTTCYENEQWNTDECSYDSSGAYVCHTVYHGSSTPYSCRSNRWVHSDILGDMDMKVSFSSSIAKTLINFEVIVNDIGTPVLKTSGLLPAGVVIGIDQGRKVVREDKTSNVEANVVISSNAILKERLVRGVKKAHLDLKNRRLHVTVKGLIEPLDKISFYIYGNGPYKTFRAEGTLNSELSDKFHKKVEFQSTRIGVNETEFELDLVNHDLQFKSAYLDFHHEVVLDPFHTWQGIIGTLATDVTAPSLKVTK